MALGRLRSISLRPPTSTSSEKLLHSPTDTSLLITCSPLPYLGCVTPLSVEIICGHVLSLEEAASVLFILMFSMRLSTELGTVFSGEDKMLQVGG